MVDDYDRGVFHRGVLCLVFEHECGGVEEVKTSARLRGLRGLGGVWPLGSSDERYWWLWSLSTE